MTFDWLDADDLAKSQRLFWQILTGREIPAHPAPDRHCVGGRGLCERLSDCRCSGVRADLYPSGGGQQLGCDRHLELPASEEHDVTVSAAHLIVPTSFGQLQKTTTAGFTVNHNINYWSSVALSANFAHTASNTSFSTGPADFFSAQIAYNYWLARDWRARLSYTYRERHDNTGTASANVGLLSLVYNFNLMGNPAAIDLVERERAAIRQQKAVGEVFPTLQ